MNKNKKHGKKGKTKSIGIKVVKAEPKLPEPLMDEQSMAKAVETEQAQVTEHKDQVFNVDTEEEVRPSKTMFVMNVGHLSAVIDRNRFDSIRSKLEKLRDDRKPKMTPEIHARLLIVKAIKFNKTRTVSKINVLRNLKTPPLDEVVGSMTKRLFSELKYKEDTSQQKLGVI
jgi:hypothetical protein